LTLLAKLHSIPKAPERGRTPKRQRHVAQVLTATFWSAALLRRFSNYF
jgi:hypothetical protein